MSVVERDLAKAKLVLTAWLERTQPGATDVQISDITVPAIGFSGEILIFDATWKAGGTTVERGIAVRVEPNGYQVFMDTNFEEQYRVQEALGGTGIAVATTIAFEPDTSILGARFYAIEKRPGTAYDVQSNPDSWILKMTADEQRKLCHNFLDVLAGIHRLDPSALGLEILDRQQLGPTPIDQQMQYYRQYYDWGRAGTEYPVIEAGFRWLDEHRPATMPRDGVIWGDARMGNQLWNAHQECTAVLDWEMTTLGPAEEDFAWFLFQDHATPETAGLTDRVSCSGTPVPAGVPSIPDTIAYYEKALGRPLENLEWWTMWAALRTAVIIVRLTPQLEALGVPTLRNVGLERVAQLLEP